MIQALIRRFRRDRRGVSAVEFALIAPVLIAAYFGLSVLCGAMLAERKASHVASAIGDLVAQATVIHDSDMTDIFSIANTVMSPYDTSATALQMRVSSINADSLGNTTVGWSDAKNMGALTKTAPYTLPTGLVSANQSIIMAEVTYRYTSPVQGLIDSSVPNATTFSEVFYLKPRQSDSITRISP